MKHTLTNPATHFAMLLMALAMAFTISCESKEEKQAKADAEAAREARAAAAAEKVAARAEAARAEIKATAKVEAEEAKAARKAACPNKKIGSPKTVEAVFVEVTCGDLCAAVFSLSGGESLWLNLLGGEVSSDGDGILWAKGKQITEGAKVSATYQERQYYWEKEKEEVCMQDEVLQSVKILSNDNEAPHEIQHGESLTYEGQTYKSVKIGEQVWMAENLNFKTGKSKCYKNDEADCKKYGRLYDQATAMKACPNGWHLPSKKEWEDLPAKAEHLKAKDFNGTDAFGFAALPGGSGDSFGGFSNASEYGYWWSSSKGGSYGVYVRFMDYGSVIAGWANGFDKSDLLSVRCVMD